MAKKITHKRAPTKRKKTKKLTQPLKRKEPKLGKVLGKLFKEQLVAESIAKKTAAENADAAIVGATPPVLVQPLGPDKKFFDNHDTNLTALVVPGVYREAGGSHTTILLRVGRTKADHVPMDAGGLRIVHTNVKAFRADWLAAPYLPTLAAEKYLRVAQFDIAPRARVALQAVADGEDAAGIRAAIERRIALEAETEAHNGNGLHDGLADAARTAKKLQREAAAANLPKGRGIGAWVREQLLAKTPDAKILAEVVKKFPGAKTDGAHLTWYRNQMKREGAL